MSDFHRIITLIFVVGIFGAIIGVGLHVKHIRETLDRIEQQSCTHGESSITAEMRNGKLHVSKPVVTGCQP